MFFTREDINKIHQALLKFGTKDSELPETSDVKNEDTLAIVQDGKNKQINIKEFFNNISLFKKEAFINITDRFNKHSISLIEAIQTVPIHQRIDGLVITFEDINKDWKIYQFRGNKEDFFKEDKWLDLYDYTNWAIDSIIPDEEDLTASKPDEHGNAIVSLKDRIYDESNFSGKGYKILRKNIQTIDEVRKNILTQNMINDPNTIYEIRYDFDLNGAKIEIKEGCILSFVGGSFYNGILFGNKTKIKGDSYNILPNIIANGSWDIKDVYPEWCGAIGDGIIDDYNAFVKALGFNCDILLTKNYNFNSKVLQIKREKLTIKGINEGGYRAGIKNGSIELVSSSNFITIKDIQIINNNVVEYGIFAKDSINKLILQNIYITKCAVSGFSLVNCWDTVFENCNATANNVGFDLTSCYSSSLKKCNAYYNTIGLKINKDAASYYNLTIQENAKTGALIYDAIGDVFNIYAEQNGWKGTTIAEKAQIWIGHLPREEGCYNCNMNLYLNGGKNSEMESSYNFYGEDIHNCVLNIFSLRAKEVGVTLTSASSYNSVTTNYSPSDTITVTNNGIFNTINNSNVCKYELLKDNTIFNVGTFAYFFDKKKFGFFNNDKKWVDMQGYPIDVINKGTSENRPTNMLFENTGFRYYDTTLKKPVYYNNGRYYDALGNIPELKTIGSDDEKPINAPLGWGYFNTTLKKQMYKGNNIWVDSEGNNIKFKKSGTFSDKPITDVPIGYAYFCIDRKSTEASSNGIVIYYKGDNVWVDALGRVVE